MKKAITILLLFAVQSAISQRDYTFVYQTDSIINKGSRLHDHEKYTEAILEYDKISSSDPQYNKALYEKALSLYQTNDEQKIRDFFKDCFDKKIQVEEPSFYVLYGSFLSDKKEYDESEKIFKEGLLVTPNNYLLLYNYAILKIRNNQSQPAIDLLKKVLTINPNHSSSHYFMGILAFDSGRITEGSLALLSYLVNEPTGRYAEKSIEMLNAKMGENYLKKNDLVYSTSGDNFTDIDEILRNQLPLKKAYKVASEFDDDPIMRQLQAICEYSLEHKMGDGFFENAYLPWIQKVMQDKQFTAMSYYILLSKETQLGKKLTNKKKDILAFADYLTQGFWNYFAVRKVEHFGKVESVVTAIKNARPFAVGPIVDGKKEGKYKILDEYGRMSAELYFKNDELEGIQKYYYSSGQIKTENEFKNGKVHGVKKNYYSNGMLSLVETYVDDKLNGVSSSYYVNGGKNCEVNFVDDERDGKLVCTYPNGTKKTEETYIKGKLSGLHLSYNAVGDIIEKYNSIDNEIDGPYFKYYDGKIIKEEATYKNGKLVGKFKSYYPNQALDEEREYVDGNIQKVQSYVASGQQISETTFDNKGRIILDKYIDVNGNMYFEEKYDSGEIKSGTQFTEGNSKPVQISFNKKPFSILSYKGKTLVSGQYLNAKKTKEWKYYYTSGNVKTVENFVEGDLNGLRTQYNFNSTLNHIGNYKDDQLNGVYEDYDDGRLYGIYHYSSGQKNGPFTILSKEGKVLAEGFYEDDEENSTKTYYRFDGSIKEKIKMIYGYEVLSESFDSKGKFDSARDYKNKTETMKCLKNNGLLSYSIDLVNGELNGKYNIKDKLNIPILDEEYVNGVNVNSYKFYNPSGALQVVRNYYCGQYHGAQKWYDQAGNLRSEENYLFGIQYGPDKRYYQNKKIMFEENYVDNLLNGETTYYNHNGEAILKLGFNNNSFGYYIKLGKSGALDEKVTVSDETASIVSVYPNGKNAISLRIEKGLLEGKMLISSAEGLPIFEGNYLHDLSNGQKIEYYTNGKIYKKEHLENGDYEGLQEYFTEDGKPIISLQYKNSKRHGETTIYSKTGKLIKVYDTDELVDIKQ